MWPAWHALDWYTHDFGPAFGRFLANAVDDDEHQADLQFDVVEPVASPLLDPFKLLVCFLRCRACEGGSIEDAAAIVEVDTDDICLAPGNAENTRGAAANHDRNLSAWRS